MVTEIAGTVPGTLEGRAGAGELMLDGGIAGAQASLLRRATADLDEALPLLEGIELLQGDSTPAEVAALKVLIRSEMVEILGELSLPRGPRIVRVEQILGLLLDQLGALQEGIEDEDNLSRFRTVTDNVASLYRSWNNIQQLFAAQAGIVTKMFGLVGDAVEEVRQTMDAVYLGLEERTGMVIQYSTRLGDAPGVTLEDLLTWIVDFTAGQGPQSLDDSGGFALRNTIAPAAGRLRGLVRAAMEPRNLAVFPKRFSTPPLQRAMKNLDGRLDELMWNC